MEETKEHLLAMFHYCPVCGSARFAIHNEKSKRCQDCGFEYYMNPSAATVAVILNERDELLVARRAKEPAKGTLDLPGGFSDCYETSEEGLMREVLEETGIQITEPRFLFSLPNEYPYSGLIVHTVDMFYYCRVPSDTPLRAMDDAAELLWIPLQDISPEDFGLRSIRQGVEKILSKKSLINKV